MELGIQNSKVKIKNGATQCYYPMFAFKLKRAALLRELLF
jgi:hypothetical protein